MLMSTTAFQEISIQSASALPFSGPAQRSLLVAARVLAGSPTATRYIKGFRDSNVSAAAGVYTR
jgi:hypothetical protein